MTTSGEAPQLRGQLDQLWGWAKSGKLKDRDDPDVEYYLMDVENVDRFTDDVLRIFGYEASQPNEPATLGTTASEVPPGLPVCELCGAAPGEWCIDLVWKRTRAGFLHVPRELHIFGHEETS